MIRIIRLTVALGLGVLRAGPRSLVLDFHSRMAGVSDFDVNDPALEDGFVVEVSQ